MGIPLVIPACVLRCELRRILLRQLPVRHRGPHGAFSPLPPLSFASLLFLNLMKPEISLSGKRPPPLPPQETPPAAAARRGEEEERQPGSTGPPRSQRLLGEDAPFPDETEKEMPIEGQHKNTRGLELEPPEEKLEDPLTVGARCPQPQGASLPWESLR